MWCPTDQNYPCLIIRIYCDDDAYDDYAADDVEKKKEEAHAAAGY